MNPTKIDIKRNFRLPFPKKPLFWKEVLGYGLPIFLWVWLVGVGWPQESWNDFRPDEESSFEWERTQVLWEEDLSDDRDWTDDLAELKEEEHRWPWRYQPEEELQNAVQAGGRFHFRASFFQRENDSWEDAWEVQRGRLYLHSHFSHHFVGKFLAAMFCSMIGVDDLVDFSSGKEMMDGRFGYGKVELDFAGPRILPRDIYLKWKAWENWPSWQIGYFKESLGLGVLTSSNDLWFMERSAPERAFMQFAMDRALGTAWGNELEEGRFLWNVGYYYRCTTDWEGDFLSNHGHGVTLRLAGRIYEDESESALIHLGIGYGVKFWESDKPFQLEVGWGNRAKDIFLATGNLEGTRVTHTLAPEFLWIWGSWGLQAEYYGTFLENDGLGTLFFQGATFQAAYWLTGETSYYAPSRGVLGRVEPHRKVLRYHNGEWDFRTGPGAIQLVYRFSWLDLSAAPGRLAGQTWEHTVGCNWLLTSHWRILTEYTFAIRQYEAASPSDRDSYHAVALGMQFYY